MDRIEVNTQKLKESGQDIIRLEQEYIELINNLFQRIYQVPTLTEEWIGKSATNYANYSIQEKSQYISYGESIKKLGTSLVNYAEELEEVVRNTNGVS